MPTLLTNQILAMSTSLTNQIVFPLFQKVDLRDKFVALERALEEKEQEVQRKHNALKWEFSDKKTASDGTVS